MCLEWRLHSQWPNSLSDEVPRTFCGSRTTIFRGIQIIISFVFQFFYSGVGADFIYDEKEKIDLPTLFNEHLKDLPKLCIVVDGIYGLTSYNNISSDQVNQQPLYRRIVVSPETIG